MSGIAELLHKMGKHVTGSDVQSGASIAHLSSLGIAVQLGHSADNVKGASVVVVSTAVGNDNVELTAARDQRIPVIHRSEMLATLMRLGTSITVTGTHGKTTTTSLMAGALAAAGADPTVVVGGRLNAFASGSSLGTGVFLAEADESDGSFLRLAPEVAVITNIDEDHLDHYGSYENLLQTFRQHIERVPFYGAACVCIDDPGVRKLLPLPRTIVTFGTDASADIRALDIQQDGMRMLYTVTSPWWEPVTTFVNLPGVHNVRNALASFAVGHVLGLSATDVATGIESFRGVLHRSTIVGEVGSIVILDDYAHNLGKIAAALRGLRGAFPKRRLVAVLQPHRYSRWSHSLGKIGQTFSDADSVIVAPVYTAGEEQIEGVHQEAIAAAIRQSPTKGSSFEVHAAQSLQECGVLAFDSALAGAEGAVIVTLGAGDVADVGKEVLSMLLLDGK